MLLVNTVLKNLMPEPKKKNNNKKNGTMRHLLKIFTPFFNPLNFTIYRKPVLTQNFQDIFSFFLSHTDKEDKKPETE